MINSPDSLNSNVLFLCGQIAKKIHEQLTQAFADHNFNVTVEQFSILAFLWYEEGTNQQHLAEVLERDKTTIARVVRNMEKKGLLIRKPDSEDQRNKLMFLSESGKRLQNEMVQAAANVYGLALEGLSETEIGMAAGILMKIKNNLD